jgi:uncharacterized protein YggE
MTPEELRVNRRRVLGSLALAASLVAAPLAGRAEERPPSVTVTGSGKVSAPPDLAQISAGVVAEAPHAADAVKQATAAMEKVVAALDKAGIEKKNVQTSRFDVSPVYSDAPTRTRGTPEITGYRASNQVQVEVHGVDKVGGVLDALVAAGANEIGGVSFAIADPAPFEDEARKHAIADARRKAELYAAATGTTLGRILSVDESGGGPAPFPVRYARMEAAQAAPPIAPGELDLVVQVVVTWAFAP